MDYTSLDRAIAGLRKEYRFGKFEDKDAAADPHFQFVKWFQSALKAKSAAINFLSLATASRKGKPSVRVVLLKGFSREGFVFFTHYASAKGRDIQENPKAEIMLYWPEVERQVRISGRLKKISRAESLRYFRCRPREAQLSAWVSHQSRPIQSRAQLDQAYFKIAEKFKGKSVPLPPFWGGYRLEPEAYEFWQGRANRLNDRIFYTRSSKKWKRSRLQP